MKKRGEALRIFFCFSLNAGNSKIGPNVVGLSALMIRLELFETNVIFEQSKTIS